MGGAADARGVGGGRARVSDAGWRWGDEGSAQSEVGTGHRQWLAARGAVL